MGGKAPSRPKSLMTLMTLDTHDHLVRLSFFLLIKFRTPIINYIFANVWIMNPFNHCLPLCHYSTGKTEGIPATIAYRRPMAD